jgi:hypothetical protein
MATRSPDATTVCTYQYKRSGSDARPEQRPTHVAATIDLISVSFGSGLYSHSPTWVPT